MAAECTHDTIIAFLLEQGGKVKNADLIKHFKAIFPEDPERKAAVRETFKKYVDSVAFVKNENGVKHVCLRKKFRAALSKTEPVREQSRDTATDRDPQGAEELEQPAAPGSGYGNDSQVRVPHNFNTESILRNKADEESTGLQFDCKLEGADSSSGEMGNLESVRRDKRESRKEQAGKAPELPEISMSEASPLPAEESAFSLPGPAQTGSTGEAVTAAESEALSHLSDSEQVSVTRCTNFEGSQRREPEATEEEGHIDTHSLNGGEDNTLKGSRKHFIEVTMNRSPQVRRSLVPRSSIYLSSRVDFDSTSVVSSTLDEDRASVALEPVEHEWMMCASDGEWSSLHRLLATEPQLIMRKDFVTGFTCLHWAAKHGKPELIALIVNFAKQHNIPISIDIRSSTGYTPLHIAAMHGHMEVVKLLVGAYNADVEIRDYSGRKACQYLSDSVSMDMWDICGAYEYSVTENSDPRDRGRWRISNLKPLKQLISNDGDSVESDGQPREKPLRRKSSLNRMKPKLQNLRARMSQIVHSTSFKDREEQEEPKKGSFRSRPKSHFFG
ncbi:ankyrin repeat domain-containing protein SOWAHC-like [Archocentrus centrarchus]|uniref:ankyrin repeat domain-containing protein SOWAHC-like n=1 Tax=Archocentrus centrarchus TaxID=63155 RepID=UPI0011E9F473|nr:ankyrin repeat domain-containing protein SOWAHC-like [Archocentrus centrarchus]